MTPTTKQPSFSEIPSPSFSKTSYLESYCFSNNWFDVRKSSWEKITRPLKDTPLRVLEIGAFEGASTVWIMDNLMDHPDSRIISVDTFEGGIDYKVTDMPDFHARTLNERFDHNVALAKNNDKLTKMTAMSSDALLQLRLSSAVFDLVYIDGSHVAIDVLSDAINAWPMLSDHGIMVFDDLHWQMYDHEAYNPGIAIQSFVRCVAPTIQIHEASGQLWVQKVERHIPPRQAKN